MGESVDSLGRTVLMVKESKEGRVQPESKQQVHWFEDGERFLMNVHCLRDKFLSPVNQAFTGNQSLSSYVSFA